MLTESQNWRTPEHNQSAALRGLCNLQVNVHSVLGFMTESVNKIKVVVELLQYLCGFINVRVSSKKVDTCS